MVWDRIPLSIFVISSEFSAAEDRDGGIIVLFQHSASSSSRSGSFVLALLNHKVQPLDKTGIPRALNDLPPLRHLLVCLLT